MPSSLASPRALCTLLFAVALTPHALLAWQPGDPWIIAALTSNTAVKPALAEAERCAAQRDYAQAAEALGGLLAQDDAAVRGELDAPRGGQPPLRLIALAAHAQYLQLHENWRVSDALCAEAEAALASYAAAARGQRWFPYNVLLDATLGYYIRRNDSNNTARLFDLAFNSGPLQTYLLARYAAWAAKQGVPASVIRARIAGNAGELSDLRSGDALTLLPLLHESDTGIVSAAIAWLNTWPLAPITEIRTAAGLITARLDPANQEYLRQYHAALAALAFRQPSDDDTRLDVIAYAVNERRKLEVLMPSLAQ